MNKKLLARRLGTAIAAALLSLGSAASANAQELVTAKVPFPFVVGTVRFPAGSYTVREVDPGSGVLQIVSAGGRLSAYTLTIPDTSDSLADRAKLRFVKSEDGYMLSDFVPVGGDPREVVVTPLHGAAAVNTDGSSE